MSGKKEPLSGKIKVVFFGTSSFGIPTLKLLAEQYDVLKVFTGVPKPAGRGKVLKKNPIHELADKLSLEVNPCEKPLMQDLPENFDVGVVVSYGHIIPKSILERAKYGFLNLHPSNLPLLRGASPIERTIEQGFERTRVCIIKMTPKLDDGDIIVSKEYKISQEEDSLSLHQKFAEIGAMLLREAIKKIVSQNENSFEKQNDALATYAKKISKEELFLPNETILTGKEVINKIRAFVSYGATFIMFEGIRVKILKAIFAEKRLTALDIKTQDGFVSPISIKPEGKKEMLVKDFLNSLNRFDKH